MFGSHVHWEWTRGQNKREIHRGAVVSLLDIFDQAGFDRMFIVFFLGRCFFFFS